MKNYSSNRAQKGKTAYRTPSPFKVQKSMYDKVLKGRPAKKDRFEKRISNF
jgi:hypothetical protein